MITFSDPKKNYLRLKSKINKKLLETLNSGFYINSNEVKTFEKNFSKYLNVKHCIGVGNATDAIFLSLKLLGVGTGDYVITPSHTATGTVLAIINTGAKPIFIDINDSNFNINFDLIKNSYLNLAKAIILVHLYGQPCKMDNFISYSKKFKIPIIEDCSQAAGATYKNMKVGSIGDLGCFSFFPTKNLGSYGDGGLISTNNNIYEKKLRSFKEYGWNKNRDTILKGINSRLDEIQASILNVKLKYLDSDNKERRFLATRYNKEITNPKIIKPIEEKFCYHVYHLYVIKTKYRKKLINTLNKNNIFPGIHYKLPVHKQKIFKKYSNNNLKITEKVSKEIISLPIFPGLKSSEQNKIIKIINNFL